MIVQRNEDELLALSGLQHLAFCERQWALIHLEGLWVDNKLTMEGRILHERVHNPFFDESRDQLVITRSVPLVSHKLGVFGIADVIEFQPTLDSAKGVKISGKGGLWQPTPVEYKRGNPKPDDRDMVQLCAQAICLEEMLDITVDLGYIYYWRPRRRQKIAIDDDLRQRVYKLSGRMHSLFREGRTPPAQSGVNCRLCSFVDYCLPKLTKQNKSTKDYFRQNIEIKSPFA
ncbi:MAG: CRISPR-associated protein Cas4 [Firmicutes bacterium]|nr:CRISPR-associated protein Cas4 [Bacillota bacterium]